MIHFGMKLQYSNVANSPPFSAAQRFTQLFHWPLMTAVLSVRSNVLT